MDFEEMDFCSSIHSISFSWAFLILLFLFDTGLPIFEFKRAESISILLLLFLPKSRERYFFIPEFSTKEGEAIWGSNWRCTSLLINSKYLSQSNSSDINLLFKFGSNKGYLSTISFGTSFWRKLSFCLIKRISQSLTSWSNAINCSCMSCYSPILILLTPSIIFLK